MTYYNTGTASVANGATAVTGSGTSWLDAVQPGDLFFDPSQTVPPARIASVTDDTHLTLAWAWLGTSLTADPYEVQIVSDAVRMSARTRELLEELSVVQANGRGLFYLFSTTTSDADPGPGTIRLNNANPALATAAYIDNSDANDALVTGVLDTWDDSGATGARGQLWLRGIADPSSFRAYTVTGSVVDGTGYRKLTLAHVGGSGGFSDADEIMVMFVPKGDKGDTGTAGTNGTNGTNGIFSAIASQAEALAGTDNTKGMTPLRTRQTVSALPFRNKLINPLGNINQLVVSGTVTLGAGAYGHDGFKAGAGGCTYTFAASGGVTTFTISAGTLQQVVEGVGIEPGTYVLGWSGTAQGRINGGSYGASGAVTAALSGYANATVEWGTGTVSLPQLERDYLAPFSARNLQQEIALCQRYFCKSWSLGVAPGTNTADGSAIMITGILTGNGLGVLAIFFRFPVEMRTVPTMVSYSRTGVINQITGFDAVGAPSHGAPTLGWGETSTSGSRMASQGNVAGIGFHWTASARL